MFFCLLNYVWPYAQITGNDDNRAACRQTAGTSLELGFLAHVGIATQILRT
jgi:hypothetical protein